MALETAQHIFQLNPSYPSSTDRVRDGDDHMRVLKAVLKRDLGSLEGSLTVSAAFLNDLKDQFAEVGDLKIHYGTEATAGRLWALCDGREVARSDGTGRIQTPDLRGKAIVGATAERPAGTLFGQASRTVTTEAAGGHKPSGKVTIPADSERTVTISGTTGSAKTGVTVSPAAVTRMDAGDSASNVPRAPFTTNDPGHTHGFEGSATIAGKSAQDLAVQMDDVAAHGHSVTVNVEQPSVSLNIFMRI